VHASSDIHTGSRSSLTDDDIPLLTRVAATLMLLYAQPLTRILRLTSTVRLSI
jgi:hypothetical protein